MAAQRGRATLFPGREDGFETPAAARCQGSLFGECLSSNSLSGSFFACLMVWEMRMAQPIPVGSLQSAGLGATTSRLDHPRPLHGLVKVGWEGVIPPEKMVPSIPAGFLLVLISFV